MALADDVKQTIREKFNAGMAPDAIWAELGGDEAGIPQIAVHGVCNQVRMARKEIERGGAAKVVETTRREYLESGDAGASGGSLAAAAGVSASPMFPATSGNPIVRIEVERVFANPVKAGRGLLGSYPPETSWSQVQEWHGGGVYKATGFNAAGKVLRVQMQTIAGESVPLDGQGPFTLVDPSGGEVAELRKELREVMRAQLEETRTRYQMESDREEKRREREIAAERERLRDERERQREWLAMMDKQQKDFMLQMAQLSARDDGEADSFGSTLERLALLKKLGMMGDSDPLVALINNKEWAGTIKEFIAAGKSQPMAQLPGAQQAAAPAAAAGAQQQPASGDPEPADPQTIAYNMFLQLMKQGMTKEQAEFTVNEALGGVMQRIEQVKQAKAAASGQQPAPANGAAPAAPQQQPANGAQAAPPAAAASSPQTPNPPQAA